MSAQQKHRDYCGRCRPCRMAVAASLGKAGHEVIILNRDIKFGGLAEYGIFPSKLKLRGGLRKQYWELLTQPNVHYFGNVSIGKGKDLTVEDVRALGASAVVFSIGAQGTKAIGVEGDRPRACSTPKMWSITSIGCPDSAIAPLTWASMWQ